MFATTNTIYLIMGIGTLQWFAGVAEVCGHFLSTWARGWEDAARWVAARLSYVVTKHLAKWSPAETRKVDPTTLLVGEVTGN